MATISYMAAGSWTESTRLENGGRNSIYLTGGREGQMNMHVEYLVVVSPPYSYQ